MIATFQTAAPGAQAIVAPDDLILVTGAGGFIGKWVVRRLLDYGFTHLRLFTRSENQSSLVEAVTGRAEDSRIQIVCGNLLSSADCAEAAKGASVVYHLAAGTGEKSFATAFLNSVVTTRNLIEACLEEGCLKRFVSISSFAVYTNQNKPSGTALDESCPVEERPALRGEAYCYAKAKQDELVVDYGKHRGLPYVILRPGAVYGPGRNSITGRVGISPFGLFFHLGGGNTIPFTYVENCADAIALAGIRSGIDGEIFNVVDDDLPTSRQFLRAYKSQVRSFRSVYVPHFLSRLGCGLWEKYVNWSEGQLPLAYSRGAWHAYWKPTRYSNRKLKERLGWSPRVPTEEGLRRFFEGCVREVKHA